MRYRLDKGLLETEATGLRTAADELSWTGARVLSVLATAGRHSSSSAALSGVVESMSDRAADLATRVRLLRLAEERILLETDLATLTCLPDEGSTDRAAEVERRLLEVTLAEVEVQLESAHGLPGGDPAALELVAALEALDAAISWNLHRSPHQPVPDSPVVDRSVAAIRADLNESWFGDVSRKELLSIGGTLADLDQPEFDAVIATLSDDELYRWFHELDGIRGGNLSEAEEAELFTMLTTRGSAATSWRLAQAEHGTRFHHLAAAMATHPDPATRLDFLLLAAADPTDPDHAIAALSGLDSLDPAWQTVTATQLGPKTLDVLSGTLVTYLDEIDPSRDDAIPIEFLEGIWDGTWEIGSAVAGLTIQGLWDRHAFREHWAGLGGGIALLFRDPKAFVSALIDLEGLKANPTHWAGSLIPDIAAIALSGGAAAAARTGKLGTTLTRLTTKLDDLKALAATRSATTATRRLSRGADGWFGTHPVELRTRSFGSATRATGRNVRSVQTRVRGGEEASIAFFQEQTGVRVHSVSTPKVELVDGVRFTLRPSKDGTPTVEVFDPQAATVEKIRFVEGAGP